MYEIVLFDLDGTLTDPKIGITLSVQYALECMGIHEEDADKLTPFIGPPLLESFTDFYHMSHEEAILAIHYYRERFSKIGLYENMVYPGIRELLVGLKEQGKKLIVATSKPNKNVYLKINVLWPEMLFVTMAMNDFVRLHARRQAKNSYDAMTDKRNIWDVSITQVRMLQGAIAKGIKEVVSEASFSRMMNLLNQNYTWVDDYATQYVDILNCKFLKMDKEKRLKNIPTMAKRLADEGDEYRAVKNEVLAAAREYNCPVDDIRIEGLEYPEEIEW